MGRWSVAAALATTLCGWPGRTNAAADGAEQPAVVSPEAPEALDDEPEGYSPPEASAARSSLFLNGYLDVGLAKAQGDGTSFPAGDSRVPATYGVDPFATAVNTRGDVASIDSGNHDTNGFLPRPVGIGNRTSFLFNTLNFDLRYQPPASPFLVFARVQFLPRHVLSGNDTRVYVEQAFGRLMPFPAHEWHLSVGKVDSVFGIEYLETQSNVRTGVTPSPMARYTTGTSVGAKLFLRQQLAALWSAISLNVAVTNSAPFVEVLQPPDVSLTGEPNLSGRLGYELNLRHLQIKLGGSALAGPRNDQTDAGTRQRMWGGDARLNLFGLSLAGEYVHIRQDEGGGRKQTGLGLFPVASGFLVHGFYLFGGYTLSPGWRLLSKVTIYGRYGRRHAVFTGFRPVDVASVTAGVRLDLGELVCLKAELLKNLELQGAPTVKNDVYTSSLVYSW